MEARVAATPLPPPAVIHPDTATSHHHRHRGVSIEICLLLRILNQRCLRHLSTINSTVSNTAVDSLRHSDRCVSPETINSAVNSLINFLLIFPFASVKRRGQSAEDQPNYRRMKRLSRITTTKPLALLGHGITDIEIHFLQIKFTAIGVYLDPQVVGHLTQWKGKSGKVLAEDDDFFEALTNAGVEKFIRVVVIKEIKGSQYGVQLESAVRDRLAADDKYEEEEEEALEKVVEFFQSKYMKKDSVITFHFPADSPTAEIGFTTEGKEESKMTVENANVAETIMKWYLGGTRGVSPSTISSLADNLSAELSK
ncbi:hypothetical protein ACFE04_016664 [Oxalis oulophora]